MPERIITGLSPDDNEIAKDLYSNKHRRYADSVVRFLAIKDRGDAMIAKMDEARANGTLEFMPYEDRAFANGDRTRSELLESAQLQYDANLWRAREHKEKYFDEYVEQAKREASDRELT